MSYLKFIIILAGIGLVVSLSGCFTGVEGTSKINLSKKDILAAAPTGEDRLLSDVSPSLLKDWKSGKQFQIADERLALVVENPKGLSLNAGDIIVFKRSEVRWGAGGGERTLLIFGTELGEIGLPVEKSIDDAMATLSVAEIPMLIDLAMVEEVRNILKGKRVWTRSALWYNDTLDYKKGKKFVPVIIKDVTPGNLFFPLLVKFKADDAETGNFFMNAGNSGNESRNFSKLFSLTDPKLNYKNISERNWKAIQGEDLIIGMTKEESKLSKGNPSEVDMGHNYSNAVEIWSYPDGGWLQFVDGLLVRYK